LLNATFRLGDRLIFPNTTWIFHRHEHWAVAGANGAGKSLFAEALRSRLPLVQGDLQYHFAPPPGLAPEEAIGHVSFEQRRLELHGMVVQSRWNSFETQEAETVADFLSYERVMEINPFEVSRAHGRTRAKFTRRRQRIVTLLRVTPLLDAKLIALSNGERQRVELARALCHPLRLLILDEPYAGLDAPSREHFHRVLEQLMSTSVRVLLLTTSIEDLPAHITHLLRVKDCRIVEAGRHGQHYPAKRRPTRSARAPEAGNTAGPLPGRNAILELRNVTVRYGTRIILRGINWTVYAGQSWALLGPNGSGKSTLLGLISGDNPQAYISQVLVFGKQLGQGESIWELKRQIGLVSPELQLCFNEAINCFDAVASGFHDTMGLFDPLTSAQRTATRRWLERFNLHEFAQTPLFALSAGLQRMVFLARALVKEPRLLLLDEPCQGLDEAHRQLFLKTVDGLIRTGSITAVYVTHRLEEIPPSIRRVKRLVVLS
jgi:molybdate transport system ATP-binding protein